MGREIAPWYFEDFQSGGRFVTSARTVTEGDMSLAVALTGHSQAIFVNEEFAKTTSFGTRIAPGEFTIGIVAGLLTKLGILENQVGLLHLTSRFPKAVKANDTVHVETTVVETKPCSDGKRGIVKFADKLLDQKSEVVLELERVAMFLCRPSP
ncbi:MAG: MaoC family dehydratase [Dehalococcoidia bacterium]